MTVLIEAWWDLECPNCGFTEQVRPLPPGSARMHTCPKLHMLTAPLVLAGTDCKVTAIERGDYLRKEEQRRGDDNLPYMAVETFHADGHTDLAVNAAVAIAQIGRLPDD